MLDIGFGRRGRGFRRAAAILGSALRLRAALAVPGTLAALGGCAGPERGAARVALALQGDVEALRRMVRVRLAAPG